MSSMASKISFRLRLFGSKRTFLFPEGCTYFSLSQTLAGMFDWDHDVDRFVIGPRTISDGSDGSEDMIRTVVDGSVSDGYFTYNDFVFDLDIKKCDEQAECPVILSNEGLFPVGNCTSEEWNDILVDPDTDPADREEIEHIQNVDETNDLLRTFWRSTPIMKGRVSFRNGIIIAQVMMMGIRGIGYDPVADRVLYGPEPSDDLIPIRPSDSEELIKYACDFADSNGRSDDESVNAFIRRNFEKWLDHIAVQPTDPAFDWADSNELYMSSMLSEDELDDIVKHSTEFFNDIPLSDDDIGWFEDSSNNS